MKNRFLATLMAFAALTMAFPGWAQDSRAWLESQGLEAVDTKAFQDWEAIVARVKGAKTPEEAQARVLVFQKGGKFAWQSNPKENEPAQTWTIHSIGRDLDGDGKPDLHFSGFTNGAHCCTTHYVYRLVPQVKKLAAYPARNVGGGDFVDLAGRKTPIMVSADDSSANEFAPYANSYFPAVIVEVSPKGRFQLAVDLMRSKLPGTPPPICATAVAATNPWLRERCGEFASDKRKARVSEIASKLREIKGERAADKLKWEDYVGRGILAAVAAEMNRYTYTGFGGAGQNWLEGVWPGNDAVKMRFQESLRKTQGASVFAEDLRVISQDAR
jgi:hypothetical protein